MSSTQKLKPKERVHFSKIRMLLFLFLIFIAAFMGLLLLKIETMDQQQQKQIQEIQEEKKEKGTEKLEEKYKDMVGWIEIKDTDFSYPVMQTKDDNQYYLHRDVDKNYSFYGTPFLDFRCSLISDNLIIYGHNINGRRYFGYLQNYRDESFYKEHPVLGFTKVGETEEKYKILSVIKTDIYSDVYRFTDVYNDKEYKGYVEKIIASSEYSCEIRDLVEKEMNENTVEAFFHRYQFLTLSTCRTGEGKNARLLVIGCKDLKDKEEK